MFGLPCQKSPLKAVFFWQGKSNHCKDISLVGRPDIPGSECRVALVNDHPISVYDIDQRVRLQLMGSSELSTRMRAKLKNPATAKRFKKMAIAAQPKSKQDVERLKTKFFKQLQNEVTHSLKSKMRKAALEELIDEQLMLQEAKKFNVSVSEEEINQQISTFASKSKSRKTGKGLTVPQFMAQFKKGGVSAASFRRRLKANISFRRLVFRKYGRNISIGDDEVDRMVGHEDSEKKTEYQLQKVRLTLPKGSDQKALAQRFVEAEQVRARFSSCKTTKSLIKNIKNASVQSLGKRTSSQVPQPTRSMLTVAKAGEMTPPVIAANAVELYAICSQRVVSVDGKERQKAKAQLRAQEVSILKRRYMRDLRQDAFIEHR